MTSDIASLAEYFQVSPKLLGAMVFRTTGFYRQFSIPKRNGTTRTILAPNGHLLKIQRRIKNDLLDPMPIHRAVHGYVKGRSVVSNATPHLRQRTILKLDIRNFFPSIRLEDVVGVFKEKVIVSSYVTVRGFQSLVCSDEICEYFAKLCTLFGGLPQGAATSPALSNLYMLELDFELDAIATNNGLQYTRYADDLCFSASSIGQPVIAGLVDAVERKGFRINKKKTRILRWQERKIVTGIAINGGRLRLPKSMRRELRLVYHQFVVKADELRGTLPEREFERRLNSLMGRLHYWRYIEKDNEFAHTAIAKLASLRAQSIGSMKSHRDLEG